MLGVACLQLVAILLKLILDIYETSSEKLKVQVL